MITKVNRNLFGS